MAELCSSSEMDVSSATHGKPEKICLVCGDKALGYNFNAVSCESCKAFFRRNAHKSIRGRCEGKCEVTVESRSFCKRCRLAKCFTVGMRKDMILNEEQKKQRKQKIITNKLRRQGQLSPGAPLPGPSAAYGGSLQHHYIKPGSPRDLQLMDLSGPGAPGKSREEYMISSPHHISSHLIPNHHYSRPHDLYPLGGYPMTQIKAAAAGPRVLSAASSPSPSSYGSAPSFPASSPLCDLSSSPSVLQHPKYYHHYHNHLQQHQQQQQHQHSHRESQLYNHHSDNDHPQVRDKPVKYYHPKRQRSCSETPLSKPLPQNESPMYIKQEAPETPDATSTDAHSPVSSYPPPQPHLQQPQPSSPQAGEFSSSSNYHRTLSNDAVPLYPSPKTSTPVSAMNVPSPISPSSSTSPRLCVTSTSSTSLPVASVATSSSPTPGSASVVSSGKGSSASNVTTAAPRPQVIPWSKSQGLVEAAINNLGHEGARDVREMMHAMEVGTFFDGNRSIKSIPNTPEEFVNTAELFVRKVIKFAKNLGTFKSLVPSDQVGLLKSSVVDIMMLRSAINYDPFSETWNLNTKGCMSEGANQAAGERISAEILKSGSSNTKKLFLTYNRFIRSLMNIVHGDRVILQLLILMSLFAADRLPLVEHDHIQGIQEHYAFLLHRYVGYRFDMEPTLFARIVMKLADLRDINEIHSDMLLHMKVDELDPLLVEIFELPPAPDGEDMICDTPGAGGEKDRAAEKRKLGGGGGGGDDEEKKTKVCASIIVDTKASSLPFCPTKSVSPPSNNALQQHHINQYNSLIQRQQQK